MKRSLQLWSRNATTPNTGKETPMIGLDRVREVVLDTNVDGRVIQVVLYALAIDSLKLY
jgi:hypothetical protein